jgi:hypothetical protein
MNTIHNMYWAMGNAEYIREVQAQEIARLRAERKIFNDAVRETEQVLNAISPFFTAEKWNEWLVASPDDIFELLGFARDEWFRIADEFEIVYPEHDGAQS